VTEYQERDHITIESEQGHTQNFSIEALFDMNDQTYALLSNEEEEEEMVLMRVVGDADEEQFLEGIDDAEEAASILEAYQIAVEAAPAE
jgi:hypothetical protein